jgi:hypothetical protein
VDAGIGCVALKFEKSASLRFAIGTIPNAALELAVLKSL